MVWIKCQEVTIKAAMWIPIAAIIEGKGTVKGLNSYERDEKGIKMSKVYRAVVLSVLCWSLLAAVYLQLLEYRVWLIFILGIPVELIIWLSSKLNK